MNPHQSSEHQSFEILCAMAASGRASAAELEMLSAHVLECSDCRARLEDFAQASVQALPFHASRYSAPRMPEGMSARFRERAEAEGILRQPAPLFAAWKSASWMRWTPGVALLILAVGLTGIKGLWRRHHSPVSTEHVALAVAATSPKLESLSSAPSAQPIAADTEIPAQLLARENTITSLKQQILTLENELTLTRSNESATAEQLSALQAENQTLKNQDSEKDAQLGELNRRLEKKDSLAAEQLASVVEKQTKLEKLSGELEQRERDLARERELLKASAEARDLITARNLHIIDVHDNDRSGRERPFGRIFYTEGHSLVFYAYDLDAANRHAKVAFHVWGGTLGDQKRVKNLGIFRNEDATNGRWVLTFDDPSVMAAINTVFVTAESVQAKEKLEEPRGKRILFAFLGDQPNHP